MTEPPNPKRTLGERLLSEEIPDQSQYEEYRMNLEQALQRTRKYEQITVHVCWITFLLGFLLMIVGGSQAVGPFDPTDADANPLSITLGVIYVLCMITWPLSLAVGFSRFRPRIKDLREEIRDAKLDQLEQEVRQLREKLEE